LENLFALQNPVGTTDDLVKTYNSELSFASYAQVCADLVLPCGALQYTIQCWVVKSTVLSAMVRVFPKLCKTKETVLPSIPDHYELANRFGDFFIGKIETIRDNLCASNRDSMSDIDALCADIEFDGEPGKFETGR
jgi:hypothetical protein